MNKSFINEAGHRVLKCDRLRRILGRSRRDRIRNEVTRKELGQEITLIDKIRQIDTIRKTRLTWFGQVTWTEADFQQ